MDYLFRFNWIRIGRKKYRSYDGRFKAYMDKKIFDYEKPGWFLDDLIFGDTLPQTSFKEARKAAQRIYNDDVRNGKILWS